MNGNNLPHTHSSLGSLGSQPDAWEEPAGIMESIVGIIPRNTYVSHFISSNIMTKVFSLTFKKKIEKNKENTT